MSTPIPVSKPLYSLVPTDVEGFAALADLALDMRWSWNHATDELSRRLDPELRELNAYRVRAFQLDAFVNSLVSSCLVQIAQASGIRSILHEDFRSTRAQLASLGLRDDEGPDDGGR